MQRIDEIRARMGDAAREAEARILLEVLEERGYTLATYPGVGMVIEPEPDEGEWLAMLDEAVRHAQTEQAELAMMLEICNDGPYLVRTTYWQTEHALRGLLYVSVNARAFRLLVPDAARAVVHEMQVACANYAIVTRGPWHGREALEILLEDGSDRPYAIHVLAAQCDRLPAPQDVGRTDLRLLVYTPAGLACEFPARYRRAPVLPCLTPWSVADTPGPER